MDEADEFVFALSKIEEAYRDGLKAFVTWLGDNWQHETKEKWPHAEPYPGDAHKNGWNEAIGTISGALEVFLDEHKF